MQIRSTYNNYNLVARRGNIGDGNDNPDLLTAVTIASAGLSGGVSSTIAGGNFWQGARQGVITSGLNHALNSLIKPKTSIETDADANETEIINSNASQTKGAKALRILGSFIAYDKDKTFAGKTLQIISHFTWELPQQIMGVFTGQFVNLIGGIESVHRYTNGSIVLNSKLIAPNVGYTMGNIITMGVKSSIETLQHEFGHYIQSRRFGPLWIPVFGIPSIMNAWIRKPASSLEQYENSFYTEYNAGKLGRKYW